MRKSIVKIACFALIVLMTTSLLIGCSTATTTTTAATTTATTTGGTSASTTAATTVSGPEPLTLPIVSEPLTLTFWCTLGRSTVSLTNFDQMAAYIELQKRTGIDIEFIHPTVGSETEQFNLLLASNDLPDLIEWSWATISGGPASYIESGVILPLNDAINQWAPNLQRVLNEHPDAKVGAMLDDGTFSFFPGIYDVEHRHWLGPTIRSDLMEKFGITEYPETIADWYEMLKKVKASDPNMLPFTCRGKAQWDQSELFMGAWGVRSAFYQVDGTVKYGPIEPGYKDFLAEMAKWYAEGLIDAEFPANTQAMTNEKNQKGLIFSQPSAMGGDITLNTGLVRKSTNPDFTMMPVNFPVLKAGEKPSIGFTLPMIYGGGTIITTACDNVKEATKLMDYNYSEEGNLLGNFGIEGLSYELVDGLPYYTDLIMKNPEGYDIASAISVYAYHSGNTALWKPGSVVNQRDSLPEQLDGRKKWMATTNENVLPRLYPTAEEGSEYASIMADVKSFTDEKFVAFITGELPIDQFDAYVTTLKNDLRIDRVLEIMQAQYDRYGARVALAEKAFN